MSHFYSSIQGHKGEATRCGTKNSGITAVAKGWDIGGEIECKFSQHLQTDVVYLYRTHGSNRGGRVLVAAFAKDTEGQSYVINTLHPELFV